MASEDHLLEHLHDGVLTLTMNRPEARNALSLEMANGLTAALQRAQLDASVRVVVLTGAGAAFCSGGDVKAMATRDADMSLEHKAERLRQRAEASRLLHEMGKPTVAVLPGPAAGAGLALALACDFRLAHAGAKLTLAFAKVGLAGDYGASYFLTQMVGSARARELLMLAPLLSAGEAHGLGLVTRVYDAQAFEGESAAFVAALANGPSVALGYIKRNVNDALAGDLRRSLDSEALHQANCFATDDFAQASKAFAEKRAPSFRGR